MNLESARDLVSQQKKLDRYFVRSTAVRAAAASRIKVDSSYVAILEFPDSQMQYSNTTTITATSEKAKSRLKDNPTNCFVSRANKLCGYFNVINLIYCIRL